MKDVERHLPMAREHAWRQICSALRSVLFLIGPSTSDGVSRVEMDFSLIFLTASKRQKPATEGV